LQSGLASEIHRVIPQRSFGIRRALPKYEQLAQKGIGKMKSKTLFAAATAFLVPALAFAGPKNSANVKLEQPVKVEGTQLAPGLYKLIWEGSGSDTTVSFTEDKRTVATVAAKLVSHPNNQEAIETVTAADNTTLLQAIDLKNITLRFENASPGVGN
jgi:hypothetical protein